MAGITLTAVEKHYGALRVVHGIDLDIAHEEFVVLVGPSGCGKSTTLRMIAGLEEITGARSGSARASSTTCPAQAQHLDGVPELCALSAHERARQPRLRVEDRGAGSGPDRGEGARGRRYPRPGRASRAHAGRAVGRPAAAGGDGAGHRPPSGCVPVRRAALEPRCQAARPDAGGDQEAAPEGAHDDRVCHPRSGRGDDARRPDRCDAGRPDRAGRGADRGLQPSGEHFCRDLHRIAADEPPACADQGRAGRACRRDAGARSARLRGRAAEGGGSRWVCGPTTSAPWATPSASRRNTPT